VKEDIMQSIAEIMSRDITTVAPELDLQQAAKLMRDLDVGALPVCDGTRLKGMITDRDIAIRGTARGLSPAAARVGDIMSQDASWCFEDQSVGEVLQQMGHQQIRRIPVLRRDSMELVGMVSLGDLAVRQRAPVESTLEDISDPVPPPPKRTGKRPGTH
jgi:CBS domain-containing protein